MTPLPTWPTNLNLADYPDTIQHRILAKVEGLLRGLSISMRIALGLLQVLALEFPHSCVVSVSPVGFALSQNMAIPVSELLNSLCNIISKGFFPKSSTHSTFV